MEDTQLGELRAVLDEIDKDDKPAVPEPIKLVVKNPAGKKIDIKKLKNMMRNPVVTDMSPAERLKLLRKRKMNEKYFKGLIKPGAFTGTKTLEEAIAEAKDDYKKFVGSSESPYYKWYVLHFLGIETKDHSLERKFAKKRAFALWNFFRSSYGRTAMERQILGIIVKHLNVDYMTKMYTEFKKMFKVKTDVQFGMGGKPKVYKYTMDEEETTLRKKDGNFTKDATEKLNKALKFYINTHKKNSNFLKAYAKHLANKNPAEAKEYVENYNNTVNLIRTLIKQKEEFERLINNTTKQIKDTEFKIKTARMKLHRLQLKPYKEIFFAEEHPADMPAEFKPELPKPEEPPKRPRDKSEDEYDTTTKKTRFGADASDDEEFLKLFEDDMSLFNI